MKCLNIGSIVLKTKIAKFLLFINSVNQGNVNVNKTTPSEMPVKLEWKLTPELEREIEISFENFKQQILANESSTLNFQNYGGQFIKNHNMSPDAYAQVALQLTYYRMFGTCVA